MSFPDSTTIPDGYKRCSRCKEIKSVPAFCVNRRLKSGLNSICRACAADLYAHPVIKIKEMPPLPGQKRCTKCKEWKHPQEFGKAAKSCDRLTQQCKSCKAIQDATYYRGHRERQAKNFKQYYLAHRSELLEYAKKYHAAHPEVNRQARRRYSYANVLKKREYHKSNPHVARLHAMRRKTRKLNLPVDFTHEDELRMFAYFDNRCAVCGCPRGFWHTLALDHWIPLASPDCPGTIPTNIVPLCHSLKGGIGGCNRHKHDRDAREWLISEFGLRKAKKIESRIQAYFDSLRNGNR